MITLNKNYLFYIQARFFMLKQISLVALCTSIITTQCNGALDVSWREAVFGATSAAVGIIGTMVYADHYYANALEKKKLEIAQEEKRKKEIAEKEEAHNKKMLAEQKAHAQQLLRHLKIHYKEEVNAINAGNSTTENKYL